MSQTPGDHRSTSAFLRSKSEADARVLDERADDALGRELWTIHADERAYKHGGIGAWLVRAQRAVA